MDRITQIYISFYPNCGKEEEDGEALVFELLKYFGTFLFPLCLFGIDSHITGTRTALRIRKKRILVSVER